MASYTDQILTFNPYIKQVDDTYATVGMMKQEQYNEGVKKIQGYVDSVNGIQVARNIDKQYIDKKLNSLTSAINSQLAGADFSNQALVAQVGGYASGIANDEVVRDAVSNTVKMKSHIDALNNAKKEGKGYAIQNEMHLMKDVKAYMDGGLNQQYQSEGYIPYQDVDKKVQDLWATMKPDSKIIKGYAPNGQTGYMEKVGTEVKWISEQDVMNQISSTLDPSAWKQLSIDAEYRYAGADIKQLIKDSSKTQLKSLKNENDHLTAQLTTTTDVKEKERLSELIRNYQKNIDDINKNNEELEKKAQVNPQAVATDLYIQNWLRGTAGRLSFTDTSISNEIYKDYYDYWKSVYDANAKGAGKEGEAPDAGFISGAPITEAQMAKRTYTQFKDRTKAMGAALSASRDDMLFQVIDGLGSLTQEQKDKAITKTSRMVNGEAQTAVIIHDKDLIQSTYDNLLKTWQTNPGKLPLEARSYFETMGTKQLEINARNEVEKKINTAVETELKKLPDYVKYKEIESRKIDNSPIKVVKADGTTYNFSGDKLRDYNNYITDLRNQHGINAPESLRNATTNELLAKHGLTQDEAFALASANNVKGSNVNTRMNAFLQKDVDMSKYAPNVINARIKLENDETRKYEAVMNPRQRILNYEDAKQRQTITDIMNVVTSDLLKSKQKEFGGIPIGDVKKALNDDERKNTTFSYSQKDGVPTMTISNEKYTKGESVDIPIDRDLAVSMGLYETDRLEAAKNIMVLRQGKTGTNIYEALPLPVTAGLLEKNTVKYELKNLNNGTYKLSLYTKGSDVPYVGDRGYTEAELNSILFGGRITDASVDAYNNGNGTATSPFTAAPVTTAGTMSYPGMNTPITNYMSNPQNPLPNPFAPQND